MTFKSANIAAHMVKFNSAVSSDFLEFYTNLVDAEIKSGNEELSHSTFAPSQMRCDRMSWFRLRGVKPDITKVPDRGLDFTAQIGTACHEVIQQRLSQADGIEWISVKDYIYSNSAVFSDYNITIEQKGYESLIDMKHPYPMRFACDGIIRFHGETYLLEIKTAEFSSLNDLTHVKLKHIDQIKCYSTILHLPHVLVLYQDRQYGEMKCFELSFSESDWNSVKDKMDNVLKLVKAHIAPEGLPVGDPDCSPSMCRYYAKCKEWGR